MTRVVALDTSTWWGSVALLEGGPETSTPVAEAGLRVQQSHAVHLLSMLDALLDAAGWSKTAVDLWVATRGPGSFTGLRVGLGTVSGLALASDRACLGVGTLEAMAEAFGPAPADRVPLLDAGRQEVYGARFDGAGCPPVERVPPWVGPPERAVEPADAAAVIFGPGADVHSERIVSAGGPAPSRSVSGSVATAAARLALRRLAVGSASGEGMAPLYVRPPDAELKQGKG